jgi:tRNA A37 threonylcarbamoyladenosine dehydratase
MMVCSFCGHENCHEVEQIDALTFAAHNMNAKITSCEDDLVEKGIDALMDEAKRRPEGFAVGATMVPDPDEQHDHADFHEHDANAKWKSSPRKIIEAEITGYEVELAGIHGEGHSMYSFDYRADAIDILEAKIEALKLLASKFD